MSGEERIQGQEVVFVRTGKNKGAGVFDMLCCLKNTKRIPAYIFSKNILLPNIIEAVLVGGVVLKIKRNS